MTALLIGSQNEGMLEKVCIRENWADCQVGESVLASSVPTWSTADAEHKMTLEPGRLLRAPSSDPAPLLVLLFRLEKVAGED